MKRQDDRKQFLVISPGIEDSGIRGLGKVTLALIESLSRMGHSVNLLTGAPVKYSRGDRIKMIVRRRLIDHYLSEGIKSSAFRLKQLSILTGVVHDLTFLLIGRVSTINNQHDLTVQHSPSSVRQFGSTSRYINFYLLYKLSSRLPAIVRSLLVLLIARTAKIDIIITASPYPIKRLPIFSRGIRIIQFVHDVMPLNILETPTDTVDRFISEIKTAINGADLVITSSHNARRKLECILPDQQPQVVYLPCVSARDNHSGSVSSLDKFGLEERNYLLFMSTLEKRKNVSRLIDAFNLIADKTSCKLVLVGGRGYGISEIEESLLLLDENRDRVIEAGYISEADKWSLINHARAVVHPSIDEGLGIPVIEGLLASVPVIATRLDSVEEFSPDDTVVYIEDPYDINEIADRMLYAIRNYEDISSLTTRAQETVETFFSNESFDARLGKALEGMS